MRLVSVACHLPTSIPMKKILHKTQWWIQAIGHSYSQIFFSQHLGLAAGIVLVTFFTPYYGAVALGSVVAINVFAYVLGFNRQWIFEGVYGFNAVLLGLALAFEFSFGLPFVVFALIANGMLLMVTAALQGILGKYHLPMLAFPFLLTYWVVFLAGFTLEHVVASDYNTFVLNQIALEKPTVWYQIVHVLDGNSWPTIVTTFFKTLGGIFFQNSVLAGVILAVLVFIFSRIAFSLIVLGYVSAFGCYQFFGAPTEGLIHGMQGANFIFLAMAIGCFFLVPNIYSYLTVLILSPVVLFFSLFLVKILAVFHLKAFTLAFSSIVAAFLFMLYQRKTPKYLQVVTLQYYSPEKTIYKYLNSKKFLKNQFLAKVSLPFWGEWMVSQGYDGSITHLGDWSKALDFVILDHQLKSYQNPGLSLAQFYCFDKPILCPMDGYVYDIVNHVDDNGIGEVNTSKNWGNTIILNHSNGLFSQISHIKKDSFKVSIGDFVPKGTLIATCGNSGRSPEPHIHFQMQTSPVIGAQTLEYPISYFIERSGNDLSLQMAEIPKEGTWVSNVDPQTHMLQAFQFAPGKKITWQAPNGDLEVWEVFTDAFNRTYLFCAQSSSYAYFVNDGVLFYFYDFEGDKRSLLFQFYIAAHRVLLGSHDRLPLNDKLPISDFNQVGLQWIQDLVAPFFLFTQVEYQSLNVGAAQGSFSSFIQIESTVSLKYVGLLFTKTDFKINVNQGNITSFAISNRFQNQPYIVCPS